MTDEEILAQFSDCFKFHFDSINMVVPVLPLPLPVPLNSTLILLIYATDGPSHVGIYVFKFHFDSINIVR